LSHVKSKEEIYPLYKSAYPDDTSKLVIGQQVGQIARFLLDIKAGDYVITPAADTEWLEYGKVEMETSYFFVASPTDGCPYHQRRRVAWSPNRLKRSDFSVPFQNTIRSSLTVFAISQKDEFFTAIGEKELVSNPVATIYDPHLVVLEQVLELDDKEFEVLISHLLTALGFEGAEHVGKPGDGGVDATGELNVANLAKVKVFVQAKRYKLGSKISANVVKQLRQAIPFGGQGAFITTADFQKQASEVATEANFPRIGLINGRQLVDLLVEHWDDVPEEFQDRLGLSRGLVRT
jgi:predicted Mrr-cat superfamily restriction endonuclease